MNKKKLINYRMLVSPDDQKYIDLFDLLNILIQIDNMEQLKEFIDGLNKRVSTNN